MWGERPAGVRCIVWLGLCTAFPAAEHDTYGCAPEECIRAGKTPDLRNVIASRSERWHVPQVHQRHCEYSNGNVIHWIRLLGRPVTQCEVEQRRLSDGDRGSDQDIRSSFQWDDVRPNENKMRDGGRRRASR